MVVTDEQHFRLEDIVIEPLINKWAVHDDDWIHRTDTKWRKIYKDNILLGYVYQNSMFYNHNNDILIIKGKLREGINAKHNPN